VDGIDTFFLILQSPTRMFYPPNEYSTVNLLVNWSDQAEQIEKQPQKRCSDQKTCDSYPNRPPKTSQR
jgi:hypothetical protein